MIPPSVSFQKKGDLVQHLENDKIAFKQKVVLNGKKLTITLYFAKDSKINPETAKSKMESQLAKMVNVAAAVGIGSGGLNKVNLTKEGSIVGEYAKDRITYRAILLIS